MNNNIKKLIVSSTVSDIGNWINRIAVLTLVLEIYNKTSSTSMVSIAMTVPTLLFGFLAGKLADSGNKKKIMLISDMTRAVLVCLIALFPEYIIITVFAMSSLAVFSDVCEDSIVPELVTDEKLGEINSIYSTISSIIMIIGPSVAGVLISVVGLKYCFIIDAISFFASFVIRSQIGYKKEKFNEVAEYENSSIKDGIRYIKDNKITKNIVTCTGAIGLASGMLNALLIVYVYDYLHQDSVGYGYLLSFKGLAMVIASIVLSKIIDKMKIQNVYKASLIGLGISLFLFPINRIWILAIIIQCMNGMFNAAYSIAKTTLLQTDCEQQYRGRVFSICSILGSITSIISLSLFGGIAELVGVPQIMGIGAIIVIMVGVVSVKTLK